VRCAEESERMRSAEGFILCGYRSRLDAVIRVVKLGKSLCEFYSHAISTGTDDKGISVPYYFMISRCCLEERF
jgi:hypothetical protein